MPRSTPDGALAYEKKPKEHSMTSLHKSYQVLKEDQYIGFLSPSPNKVQVFENGWLVVFIFIFKKKKRK